MPLRVTAPKSASSPRPFSLARLFIALTMVSVLVEFSACEPGASCDCTVSINGTSKTSKTCGEKLCFNDGSAFECTIEGSKEVSSCNTASGGGGGTATGGGTGGGGGAATGGGTGGGSSSSGGGTGGGSGPACMGTFSCGAITCDAATQACNVTFTPARCVANTTACRTPTSYCFSATSISNCQSGKRFSCGADSVTGGVTYGCR